MSGNKESKSDIMKPLFVIALCIMICTMSSSQKSTTPFCIDCIQFMDEAHSAEHTFNLPDGTTYEGNGALPFEITLGKYTGTMRSIVLTQEPRETGEIDVTLVHFFEDGQGNNFWTSDKAVMTAANEQGTVMNIDDVMTVIGDTGDFECATGELHNVGTLDFTTFKLEVQITGSVCGGCK